MATTTTNYGLTKPSYGDNADIAVINSNMDKIDAKMKEIEDAGGGGASTATDITYDNATSGIASTNVQDAIDEVFQSVSDGKVLLAEAITDKGVPTSATDNFSTMANNIRNISGGGGVTSELIYTLLDGGVWKDVGYTFKNNDYGFLNVYSSNSEAPVTYSFCVRNIVIYSSYTTIAKSSEGLNINLSRVVVSDDQSNLKISLSDHFKTTTKIELYKLNI